MTPTKRIQGLIVIVAVVGLCMPEPLFAAELNRQPPNVVDVKLLEGGVLLGQAVDAQGAAAPETPIAILDGNQELATTKTRGDGYFAFRGLRGGVYQLTTAESQGIYRLWAPGSAPPSAQDGALLVVGNHTVRGQYYVTNGIFPGLNHSPVGFWLSNPWVLGGIVATAVAVPVVLHNRNRGPHSP